MNPQGRIPHASKKKKKKWAYLNYFRLGPPYFDIVVFTNIFNIIIIITVFFIYFFFCFMLSSLTFISRFEKQEDPKQQENCKCRTDAKEACRSRRRRNEDNKTNEKKKTTKNKTRPHSVNFPASKVIKFTKRALIFLP